jgi:hypothetical protein
MVKHDEIPGSTKRSALPDAGAEPRGGPVLAPISVGELFDKITILEIKAARIIDSAKQVNVLSELGLLREVSDQAGARSPMLHCLIVELKRVNEALWEIEDEVRACERQGEFGPYFIALARAVYRTNDRRAQLKRQINEVAGSPIIEEKSYKDY